MKHPTCIGDERAERLIGHLEKLARQTGMPLEEGGYPPDIFCPIVTFAPRFDVAGRKLVGAGTEGFLTYWLSDMSDCEKYDIYTLADSEWWLDLTRVNKGVCRDINCWLFLEVPKINKRVFGEARLAINS